MNGTGRRFDYRSSQSGSTPLWKNHAVGTGKVCGTDDGTQIVWVFDAIQ